ncbi:hypothetical protein [Planococcus sp. YIM B11945]|uniref:hypothetical protein n=1 Tax=Planococcus sp. YIM B11945 TaxID=3435410 RepID=UPI003D7D552A
MKAPENILSVWKKFDDFPMETFTKAWHFEKAKGKKQRSIALMNEYRKRYGVSGNCFDLAIWLLDEFKKAGIRAYPIGNELNTEDAHAAVIAVGDNGCRYLCDLGDLWLQPILIDSEQEEFTSEKLPGFFPAAEVQLLPKDTDIEIIYHRPGGKQSNQFYETREVGMEFFMEAAEFSQNHVYPKPLFEKRVPHKDGMAHWEFDDWKSFLSTNDGLFPEKVLDTTTEWAERIHQWTGVDRQFLFEALEIYGQKTVREKRELLED